MIRFKIIYYMFKAKIAFWFFLSCISLISQVFFENYIFTFFITLFVFLVIYCWFIGPLHYFAKQYLHKLVDKGVVINTEVYLFTQEFCETFPKMDDWVGGMGELDRSIDDYKTLCQKNGIYVLCLGMPYLPVHFIPFDEVQRISFTRSDDLLKLSKGCISVYSVYFSNGCSWTIPLSKLNFDEIQQINDKYKFLIDC